MPMKTLSRRHFIQAAALGTAALQLGDPKRALGAESKAGSGNPLPRWRGFNLTDYF